MTIDILAAIIISLGAYLGYQRGLIKTVFDTLSLIIGIVAALKLSPITISFLQNILKINPSITFVLGIALTFILVMYGIRFIGSKLEQMLTLVKINFVNKAAGGVLQGLFFATILALVISLFDKLNLVSPETKNASVTYVHLEKVPKLSEGLLNSLRPIFSNFWDLTMETVDNIKSKKAI
jgi:membrane protein required for colicin V production